MYSLHSYCLLQSSFLPAPPIPTVTSNDVPQNLAGKQLLQPQVPVYYLPFIYVFSVPNFLFFFIFTCLIKIFLPGNDSIEHLMSPQIFQLSIFNNFNSFPPLNFFPFLFFSNLGLSHRSHKISWNAFGTTSFPTQPSSPYTQNTLGCLPLFIL